MQASPPTVSILEGHARADDFVAVAEHDEATPSSFYNGKPVLHASFAGASIALAARDVRANSELSVLTSGASLPPPPRNSNSNSNDDDDEKIVLQDISGFVTSEHLLLWSARSGSSSTLAIPYHAIALHAIQTAPRASSVVNGAAGAQRTVYLQLEPSAFTWTRRRDADEEEEEAERDSIELSLIPAPASASAAATNGHGHGREESHDDGAQSETGHLHTHHSADATSIFEALSRCADLHPDLGALDLSDNDDNDNDNDDNDNDNDDDDDDGGGGGSSNTDIRSLAVAVDVDVQVYQEAAEAVSAPRSTNSVGEGLGAGAGTLRSRHTGHYPTDNDHDNNEEESEETKWRRTS